MHISRLPSHIQHAFNNCRPKAPASRLDTMMRIRRARSCPIPQTQRVVLSKPSSNNRSPSVPRTRRSLTSALASGIQITRVLGASASTRSLADVASSSKHKSQTEPVTVEDSCPKSNINAACNGDNVSSLIPPLRSSCVTNTSNNLNDLSQGLSSTSTLQTKQLTLYNSTDERTEDPKKLSNRNRQDSPDFVIVDVRPVQTNRKKQRMTAGNLGQIKQCPTKRVLPEKQVPVPSKRVKRGIETIPEYREVKQGPRINMSEFANMWDGTQSQKLATIKQKHWIANGWSAMDYYTMALMAERAFPYEEFQSLRNKAPTETREVFRAVVETELLKHAYRGKGEVGGGPGEDRIREYKQLEHIQKVGKAEGWCEEWYWEQVEKSSMRTMEIIREAEQKLMQKETERIRANPGDMKRLEKEAEDKIRDGLMALKSTAHQTFFGQNKVDVERKLLETQESSTSASNKCSELSKAPVRPVRGRKPLPVLSVEEATDRWHEAGVELMKAQKKAKQQEKRSKKEVDTAPSSKAKPGTKQTE